MEEFSDFTAYVQKIERDQAHLASGICKIIPPAEWSPRPSRGGDYKDVDNYVIDHPVKETVEGCSGTFIKSNDVYKKSMQVSEFRKLATSPSMSNPKPELSLPELERYYWRNIL